MSRGYDDRRLQDLTDAFWDDLEDREITSADRIGHVRATMTAALERVLRAAINGDDI